MSDTQIDEGYVKYTSDWQPGPEPDDALVSLMEEWRRPLHAAGLIGHYVEHSVGYGNISVRAAAAGQFVISGTQTGHLERTGGEHYALVVLADIAANSVSSIGPVKPSSEALTHAALYALSPSINAVVHIHSSELWQSLRDTLPTTDAEIAYGTPAMAHEFERLWQQSDFPRRGIAVMAGHEEGLVSVGKSLEQAAKRMLDLATDS